MEIVLWGRSPEKLQVVARFCSQLAEADVVVRATTDLEAALSGADVVLNQVRVGGYRARAFDETFPHDFGLPGEETMGPGGFANAWRTVPVVVELARAIERVAPDAWVVTLTNPSSVVQLALHRTTRLRVIGVCDAPTVLHRHVAALVGCAPGDMTVDYVGMHHFGWITRAFHRGRNLMADILDRVESLPNLLLPARLVQAIGAIPHPYLHYVLMPQVMLARQRDKPPRGTQLMDLEVRLLEEYRACLAAGRTNVPEGLRRRNAVWYREIVVPVICALLSPGADIHIVNFENGHTVGWLPPDAVIEGRAVVTADGPSPLVPCGGVPADVIALTQQNQAYESLLVNAILGRSVDQAWRAMTMNPLVRDAAQARLLVERILADSPASG